MGGMGGAPADGVVVLNEIEGQGDGDDYIELFNRGPGDADLGGYGIADENNTFLIPSATILEPGEYLLLLLGGQPRRQLHLLHTESVFSRFVGCRAGR